MPWQLGKDMHIDINAHIHIHIDTCEQAHTYNNKFNKIELLKI